MAAEVALKSVRADWLVLRPLGVATCLGCERPVRGLSQRSVRIALGLCDQKPLDAERGDADRTAGNRVADELAAQGIEDRFRDFDREGILRPPRNAGMSNAGMRRLSGKN